MTTPYRVPLMTEIAKIPDNGLRIVSTFSGCGGSCLGFRMAGYRTLWANEFIGNAADTYEANHPGVPVNRDDIRSITAQTIRDEAGIGDLDVDVLEGSPPCAPFSSSGKRFKKWGQIVKYSETKQRVDDLFDQYVRILSELRPKVFVAENVKGILLGRARGWFREALRSMRDAGYQVEARLLNAKWLGVPQARERVIFIGVRKDIGRAPVFPTPLSRIVTVREAIGDLPMDPEDVPVQARLDAQQGDPTKSYSSYKLLQEVAPGCGHPRRFSLKLPAWDKPVMTLCQTDGFQGSASNVHPERPRKFVIPEVKRLCSFPDDFILTGNYIRQYERLGRAVPPLMMKAVAETIASKILTDGGRP